MDGSIDRLQRVLVLNEVTATTILFVANRRLASSPRVGFATDLIKHLPRRGDDLVGQLKGGLSHKPAIMAAQPASIRLTISSLREGEMARIFSAEDWAATLVAAAGEPDIKVKLLQGYTAGGKTYKVHLDGYDQRDLLSGKGSDKRREFFYWTDDGNLCGLRYEQWKAVFMEQRDIGLSVWSEPLIQLRVPKLFNLRSDPFERAEHEAGDYGRWFVDHAFVVVPAQVIVARHIQSFQDFPPRQRPGSFSVEQALEKLRNPPSSN
jgi:arylsulfatase